MKVKLDESVILITGASSGIGYEFAKQLAPRAKVLILVARRSERLSALKAELLARYPRLQVRTFASDVTDFSQVDQFLASIDKDSGSIDILINNAGVGDVGLFDRTSWPRLDNMIKLNVTAFTYLLHKILPTMIQRRSGAVLAVGSTASLLSLPGFGAYSATKYYVDGLIEAVRAEALPAGVVVSQLCPGPVKTEFGEIAAGDIAEQLPGFVEISAEKCVSDAIRDFEKGKFKIYPGMLFRILATLSSFTPGFVTRFISLQLAKKIRSSGAV